MTRKRKYCEYIIKIETLTSVFGNIKSVVYKSTKLRCGFVYCPLGMQYRLSITRAVKQAYSNIQTYINLSL